MGARHLQCSMDENDTEHSFSGLTCQDHCVLKTITFGKQMGEVLCFTHNHTQKDPIFSNMTAIRLMVQNELE